jgi:indole-3-glycerol phosphate synthase/phosphoribosylanthranilate isomerase
MSGTVLERIVARTRERVALRRVELPLEQLRARPDRRGPRRSFAQAIARTDRVNVIAEYKRRSPSRGVIREDLGPVEVAQAYEVGGAAALSVLTEEQSFGGSLHDLTEARHATLLPTLRKDFIVDPYQVWEARDAGADALLLIVGALREGELRGLLATCAEAELDALVEVHDRDELERALAAGARIVGVNNRDLRTLEVRIATSFELAPLIPEGVLAVAESGIRRAHDVGALREAGYDAFLIGEHLMSSPDPGPALEAMAHEASAWRPGHRQAWGAPRALVKVCGITRIEDALMAARAGADAIGLVFWPGSVRAVDPVTARRITRALPPFVLRVGVFVDASRETIEECVTACGLDLVQLHGDEPPELPASLSRRALKALRVGPDFDASQVDPWLGRVAGVVLDTRAEGSPGGTGRSFDWSLVAGLRDKVPFLMLAGGLTPENVAQAVAAVHPDAVDVSSGVEASPGRKDPARVRRFIEAARAARR